MTTTTKTKSRSYGVNDIYNWKFESPEIPKEWHDHLGNIPKRWLMYVDGDPGHGKTEYIMLLAKMIANYIGRVRVNNVEQGKHVQIQQSAMRNDFKNTIPKGKFVYHGINDFSKYQDKITGRGAGRVQIIDSISYFPLTTKQVQELVNDHKQKSFVFVGYKKHFSANTPIIHMCDIKVRVENFLAQSRSRYGGNQIFDIWPEKNQPLLHSKQLQLPDVSDFDALDKEEKEQLQQPTESHALQAD